MPKKLMFLLIMIFGMFFLMSQVEAKEVTSTGNVEYRLAGQDAKCKKIDPNGEFWKFLQDLFNIIKFAGPILCIVLSTMDFVKAAAAQDKEALAKAAKTSLKRLALAMLLFFIPVLINFLFPLLGWVGTCGIS